MSSINRPLASDALHFRLRGERAEYIDDALLARAGRSARTLVKNGPLRVTLVALAEGGSLASHRAEGPITVQVLSGGVRFRVGEKEWELREGDLLSLDGGVEHSVESPAGGEFLLTVVNPAG